MNPFYEWLQPGLLFDGFEMSTSGVSKRRHRLQTAHVRISADRGVQWELLPYLLLSIPLQLHAKKYIINKKIKRKVKK